MCLFLSILLHASQYFANFMFISASISEKLINCLKTMLLIEPFRLALSDWYKQNYIPKLD